MPLPSDNVKPVLLLSCGGDGLMRVWMISGISDGKLICSLPGAQVCVCVCVCMCARACACVWE